MFYAPATDLNHDLRFQVLYLLWDNASMDDRRVVTDVINEIQSDFEASKLQMIEAANGIY